MQGLVKVLDAAVAVILLAAFYLALVVAAAHLLNVQ